NLEFLPGRTLTLTATFSDGTTATAVTTAPASPLITLTYNGKLPDRIGQGNIVLAPDGAPDGTLTATINSPGDRTTPALRPRSDAPVTVDTRRATRFVVLPLPPALHGLLLNSPFSLAVALPAAICALSLHVALPIQNLEFLPGRTLTLTATFSDGTIAT